MANIYSPTGLQAATQYFTEALLKYGRRRQEACDQIVAARDPVAYVGQFIDREGVLSSQHGVYGMSAWLTLTQSTVSETDRLRVECRKALKQWVQESRQEDVKDHPEGNPYELRFVVPKICYAYRAMMAVGCEEEGRILFGYIQEASHDGSWGYLTSSDSEKVDACMTALVVRTFGQLSDFATTSFPQSLRFLQRNYRGSKNPCVRLYVLNALQRSDPNSRYLPDINPTELIKEQIRELYTDIQNNPLSVSNPVTIHFADEAGHRLRYYRFPGDLIVLESLLLISGPHIRFYPYQFGRHIGNRLGKILDGPNDLAVDTCDDRMSFPTCLYVKDVLSLLNVKIGRPQHWSLRVLGSIVSMFTFRREAKVHLIALLVALVFLMVVYLLWEEVFKVVLGAVLVEVIFTVREALTWWWGEHRSEEP